MEMDAGIAKFLDMEVNVGGVGVGNSAASLPQEEKRCSDAKQHST